MPEAAFTDQRHRLKRIFENALDGAAYESSEKTDAGRVLLLRARRPNGTEVFVKFLGVRDNSMDTEPQHGSPLKLRSVTDAGRFSFLRILRPGPHAPTLASRVRIEAGSSSLEIVCEDAEWWEES